MIPAIGAVGTSAFGGGWTSTATAQPLSGAADLTAGLSAPAATGAGGSGFGDLLAHSLDQLQQVQTKSDTLAVSAATGDLKDVHDYMIASTQASLATDLAMAVRNKALDSFNEIMRMPV